MLIQLPCGMGLPRMIIGENAVVNFNIPGEICICDAIIGIMDAVLAVTGLQRNQNVQLRFGEFGRINVN